MSQRCHGACFRYVHRPAETIRDPRERVVGSVRARRSCLPRRPEGSGKARRVARSSRPARRITRSSLSLSLFPLCIKNTLWLPCSPLAPNPLALEPNALFGEKCAAAPVRPLSRVGARLPRPRLQPLPSRRFRHRKPCLLTPLRGPQL